MSWNWKVAHNQVEKRRILEDHLPPDYSYQVTFFSISETSPIPKENKFSATVNVNICTTTDLQSFLDEFNVINNVSYKINSGDRKDQKTVLLSGSRHCMRNVRKRKSPDSEDYPKDLTSGKNTGCSSKIKFKLSKHLHTRNCSGHFLQLHIEYQHNHHIETAINVRMQPVSNDTKNRFIQYFNEKHSASSAYHANKDFLQEKYKNEYTRISANRSYCPDYAWVSNFSSKFVLEKFGAMVGPESLQKAHEYCQEYNKVHGKELARVVQKENGHYFVVLLDEFILRAHLNLPQAENLALLDITGSLDRVDSRLARFLTVGPSGGIPLGNIIVSSESEALLTEAFQTFQDMLPEESWKGRGKKGPVLVITDDCTAEISAVRKVWPEAKNLLCQFHLLQALWRWLLAGAHGVAKKDRPHLFFLFRSLVYSETSSEFDKAKEKLMEDDIFNGYKNFEDHITKTYLDRSEAWATHVRLEEKYPNYNVNTTNYLESSFGVTKNIEFHRHKDHNVPELVKHLLEIESGYWVKKLVDVGNGIFTAFSRSSNYHSTETTISKDQIVEVYTGRVFYVRSQSSEEENWYQVDMRSGACECPIGSSRAPCKHKHAVKHHYQISEFTALPVDPRSRAMWHYIALGSCEEETWYRNDKDTESEEVTVQDYINDHLPSQNTAENVMVTVEENDQVEINVNENTEDNDNLDNVLNDDDIDDEDNFERNSDEDEPSESFDAAWNEFKNDEETEEKFRQCWQDEHFRKAFRKFITKWSKLRNSNQNTIIRHFHDFAVEKKRKHSYLIPVQSTAITRRKFKSRGRTMSQAGRRYKEVERRTETFTTDTDENTWHSLPAKKRPRLQMEHSLPQAVANNRNNAKKH